MDNYGENTVSGLRLRRGLVVMAGMVLVLTAACSSGGSAASGSAAPHANVPVPKMTSETQQQLPLSGYELSNAQQAETGYLYLLLKQKCMAALGFQYAPGLSASYVSLSTKIYNEFDSRLWGVSDPVAAREYGYGMPPWEEGTTAAHSLGGVSSAEARALSGHSGCSSRAERELAAEGISLVPGSGLVGSLSTESWERAKADPRVLAVFAKWSACMKSHGYNYSSPLAVAGSFGASGRASQEEIQTAVTDVNCKTKTNLLGVTFAVESDYQNELINKYAVQLAALRRQVQRQAKALLSLARRYGI
jgi:hypothetical protein